MPLDSQCIMAEKTKDQIIKELAAEKAAHEASRKALEEKEEALKSEQEAHERTKKVLTDLDGILSEKRSEVTSLQETVEEQANALTEEQEAHQATKEVLATAKTQLQAAGLALKQSKQILHDGNTYQLVAPQFRLGRDLKNPKGELLLTAGTLITYELIEGKLPIIEALIEKGFLKEG